ITKYAEILLAKSLKDSLHMLTHNAYLQLGNALRYHGELKLALESFFKSMEYSSKINFREGEGKLYVSIADTYSEIENSPNASKYYNKGIEILREVKDSISLAKALNNASDEYFNRGKLDSALLFANESAVLFQRLKYPLGQGYSLGIIGMVYAGQGNDNLALANINKAIAILEQLEDYYPISVYLNAMSDIYLKRGDISTAISYAQRSLDLASSYRLKDQMSAANLKLAELYQETGSTEASYKYYKDHILYRDSVKNIESVQQMADLETNYQVSQKQLEVDLLSQQKKIQKIIAMTTASAMLLIGLLAVGLFRRYKFIKKTKRIIEEEKNRSETLLLNILPEETAFELKEKGKVQAKKFDSATVLFTDFKDFTKSAGQVAPELLVESIDYYFKAFDAIITKYDLEKIKTIGDAYMCAGGIPTASTDHANQVVLAANEIAQFVQQELQASNNRIHFEIRIGIHTGPVVAGIVGDKKWQYDIWGDTVNIASRMESNSEPGKINISEATYELIRADFLCKYRGEIEVKNRGSLKMYFLEG
ncbi:MAG: adenylate/guanylate cyclase domain-containing protein, partial [Eudoraea sp.]